MNGSSSAFVSGCGFGIWLGLLTALRLEVHIVRSQAWKGAYGLSGGEARHPSSSRELLRGQARLQPACLTALLSQTNQPQRCKGDSVALASALMPLLAETAFTRKKDHGRAEASPGQGSLNMQRRPHDPCSLPSLADYVHCPRRTQALLIACFGALRQPPDAWLLPEPVPDTALGALLRSRLETWAAATAAAAELPDDASGAYAGTAHSVAVLHTGRYFGLDAPMLKLACKLRGLRVGGAKSDLLSRLEGAETGLTPADPRTRKRGRVAKSLPVRLLRREAEADSHVPTTAAAEHV